MWLSKLLLSDESAVDSEEVTFSDIAAETEEGTSNSTVIDITKTNQSGTANDLDPAAPADPSAPAEPDPAEFSVRLYLQKQWHECKSLRRPTRVLLSVCLFVLVLAVAMGGLYVMNVKKYLELKSEIAQQKFAAKCAPGWEYYDGRCYYFSTDMMNWTASRDACVTMGGHLAMMKSNIPLMSLKASFWIGLSQEPPEGGWYWVDNTGLNTNGSFWKPTQPDNSVIDDAVNGEDCVEILDGLWNDNSCGRALRRICESKSCS